MSRKAGSEEFKEELSRAERNRRAREEKSNNPEMAAERANIARSQDEYDFDLGGYSDKEISMALQGEKFGLEDYKRLTGQDYGDSGDVTATLPPQGGGGQVTGNVSGGNNSIISPISQDNDIAIAGNSNSVNQDNSITQTIDTRDQSDNRRYYGGSNRVFNYGGAEDGGIGMSKRFLDKFINKSVINNSNVVDFSDSQIGSFNPGKNPIRDMRIFGN